MERLASMSIILHFRHRLNRCEPDRVFQLCLQLTGLLSSQLTKCRVLPRQQNGGAAPLYCQLSATILIFNVSCFVAGDEHPSVPRLTARSKPHLPQIMVRHYTKNFWGNPESGNDTTDLRPWMLKLLTPTNMYLCDQVINFTADTQDC